MGDNCKEHDLLSFYKIYLDEFAKNLRLPHAFVKKLHLEGKILENPVLKIQTCEKWRVEIEESGGRTCFGKGWLDFVKDTQIQVGDFLLFHLIGNSIFQVSIFAPNGCQKDLSFASPTTCKGIFSCRRSRITDTDLKDVIKIEEDDGDVEKDIDELQSFERKEESLNPCFRKVMTKAYSNFMELPSWFPYDSRLRNQVTLRNKAGREWAVGVKKRSRRGPHGRVYLSRGWSKLRKENKLMNGDICYFQYIQGESSQCGLIEFEVVKGVATERERGRPPRILTKEEVPFGLVEAMTESRVQFF